MEFDERVPNSMGFRETSRFLKKFSEVSKIPTGSIWLHRKCCKCANRNDTTVSWRNRARNLDIPIGILMFLKCSGWPCPFYAPSMPLVRLLCPMYAPSMSTITHFQYFHQKSGEIPWRSMKSSSFQEILRKFLEYAHFNGIIPNSSDFNRFLVKITLRATWRAPGGPMLKRLIFL